MPGPSQGIGNTDLLNIVRGFAGQGPVLGGTHDFIKSPADFTWLLNVLGILPGSPYTADAIAKRQAQQQQQFAPLDVSKPVAAASTLSGDAIAQAKLNQAARA